MLEKNSSLVVSDDISEGKFKSFENEILFEGDAQNYFIDSTDVGW